MKIAQYKIPISYDDSGSIILQEDKKVLDKYLPCKEKNDEIVALATKVGQFNSREMQVANSIPSAYILRQIVEEGEITT